LRTPDGWRSIGTGSEHSEYSGGPSAGAKWGYIAGALIGMVSFAAGMLLEFFGDCPPGYPCHEGEGRSFLLIILVSLLLALASGTLVRRLVNGASRGD